MTQSSELVPSYAMSALDLSTAENIARVQITDAGDVWVFDFGVDGNNVGLASVNLNKYRVQHLNILGALEVALRELPMLYKNNAYTGKSLSKHAEADPAITDGSAANGD